jgi:hypothetical protein
MWVYMLILFFLTVVLSAVFGSTAKANFVMLLRDRHPDIYRQLGRPEIWANTSLSQGVKMQKFVFSKRPVLCQEAEAARTYLRRVTIMVLTALVTVIVLLAWSLARDAGEKTAPHPAAWFLQGVVWEEPSSTAKAV